MVSPQATARIALSPIGLLSNSPRRVSMTGVKGWYRGNQASQLGIDSVGTNPLPRNGRMTRNMGRLLAVSTLLLTSPNATDSQVRASVVRARRAIAAIHRTGPA